jgi:uncharacterized protein YjbI with pentapeptide repeats
MAISISYAVIEGPLVLPSVTFQSNVKFADCVFTEKVDFSSAVFQGILYLSSSTFEKDFSASHAVFNGSEDILHAHFKQSADFSFSAFGDLLDMTATQFINGGEFGGDVFRKKADFDSVEFDKPSIADVDAADFSYASAAGEFYFGDAKVFGRANFDFARFETNCNFQHLHMEANFDFTGAVVGSAAYFTAATFFNGADFVDGHVGTAVFTDAEFESSVDLRHFAYLNISLSHSEPQSNWLRWLGNPEEVDNDWPRVFRMQMPYDREPFSRLERFYRSEGQDDIADQVYLESRNRERREVLWPRGRSRFLPTQWLRWFADRLYGLLVNYGIRPYRLVLWAIMILMAGTWVFRRKDAVTLAGRRDAAQGTNSAGTRAHPGTISTWNAFAVSLHQFLPVDTLTGANFEPSRQEVARIPLGPLGKIPITPVGTATMLRIAGWILVPLGVAILTGILHQTAP